MIYQGSDAAEIFYMKNYTYGTSKPSEVRALGGDDEVYGSNIKDRVFGNYGDDSIYGESGDDLDGAWGNDLIYGDNGNDIWNGSGLASIQANFLALIVVRSKFYVFLGLGLLINFLICVQNFVVHFVDSIA